MTAMQHIEQQKNGTSVKGMVECFTATYDSREKEQIIRTTALSRKNSRMSRERVAISPIAKKTMFNPTMNQEWAKPKLSRRASNAG
jgi:uncharacterized protein YeeX (DUF496 family)